METVKAFEDILSLPEGERAGAMKGWKMDQVVSFLTYTQKKAEEALASANAKVKSLTESQERAITVKVSEKGAFSVYGLGRFPVTLYDSQWEKLSKAMGEINAFRKANENHPLVAAARQRKEGTKV